MTPYKSATWVRQGSVCPFIYEARLEDRFWPAPPFRGMPRKLPFDRTAGQNLGEAGISIDRFMAFCDRRRAP